MMPPSITPAGQEVEILDYLFTAHGVENVLLVLGQVVQMDPRLEYALMRGRPSAKESPDPKLQRRHALYRMAVRKLAIMVSQSRGSHNIFTFLLRAFPDAMAHFNIQISQERGGGFIGSAGDNVSALPKAPSKPAVETVPEKLSAKYEPKESGK